VYDPELPGCFGRNDGLFAVHPLDADRALAWLIKLRSQRVTWREVRAQIEAYLREAGCSEEHIAEQVAAAKWRMLPWLYGPEEE